MSNIQLENLVSYALDGSSHSIDRIMKALTSDITIADSKKIDYALGLVNHYEGISHIEHYLFHGTQIQRNYCTLFFNRRGDWKPVKKAFELGLIDEIQAYAK